MRYTIPFTKESVKKEICGRTMCLGTKLVAGHQVYPKKEIVLLSVVSRGVLRMEPSF